MHAWLKKAHIYLGLLNFCALTVFGLAGLTATFQARPGGRRGDTSVEWRSFTAPGNASDKQVADLVYRALQIPLSTPVPEWAIRRDPENHLRLDFYTLNGIRRVTLLESEHKLRVEHADNTFWQFVNDAHTVTQGGRHPDLRIRLWGYYNEFAIWSLLAMSATGLYLWLASRPRFRWAQYSFASGAGIFILLYFLTR